MRQALRQARLDRIVHRGCNERRPGGGLHGDKDGGAGGDDHVHFLASELGRERRQALVLRLRPAIFDPDVASLDPAEFLEPRDHGGDQGPVRGLAARAETPTAGIFDCARASAGQMENPARAPMSVRRSICIAFLPAVEPPHSKASLARAACKATGLARAAL